MTYSFLDVLLVDFPLTNRSGSKKRPGLVGLDIGDTDWEGTGLAMPSLARIAKLSTIDKMFVKRKLGELQERDKTKIIKALNELWML